MRERVRDRKKRERERGKEAGNRDRAIQRERK
jgi:hypothetical protein